MSQAWNKKATAALGVATRARNRAAKEKPPTPPPYDSPITYTRLKFMQECARAQHTQGKYQFLPEGTVEDELQEDWYQIIDEAVGSFQLRFVCRVCRYRHLLPEADKAAMENELQELKEEMDREFAEDVTADLIDKWTGMFESLEGRWKALLGWGLCEGVEKGEGKRAAEAWERKNEEERRAQTAWTEEDERTRGRHLWKELGLVVDDEDEGERIEI